MRKSNHGSISKLIPLQSLGLVKIDRGQIRVEKLEDRLNPHVPFPHRHDFYQLIFVRSGKGWHEIDFNRHPVQPRQFFVMKPSQVHTWKLNGVTGTVIEFTHESVSRLGIDLGQMKHLPDAFELGRASSEILSITDRMLQEFTEKRSHYERCLELYLSLLLLNLGRDLNKFELSQRQPEASVALKLQSLIEEHFREHRNVEYYAERPYDADESRNGPISA